MIVELKRDQEGNGINFSSLKCKNGIYYAGESKKIYNHRGKDGYKFVKFVWSRVRRWVSC